MSTAFYNDHYFRSSIFNFDYGPVADAILSEYAPKTVIEIGCGNGELTKALAKEKISIVAIDGYSNPDFKNYANIEFHRVNLNDAGALNTFRFGQKKFDLAICLEVAEHLKPNVSRTLIETLTSLADIVIFSAAVPGQDGDGHVNCRERSFWHTLFDDQNFLLRDTIRTQIRNNQNVGRWYALNILDYVKNSIPPSIDAYKQVVANLVASESAAASHYYLANRKLDYKNQLLKMDWIWAMFKLRNGIKKILGKPANPFDKI
ncbi:MAG: methyltransferase domain-containing protein [Ferruginibacter sp.]|nr:methyltransferase domain-containing protein [Ferruginibacter sp.]